MSARRSPPLVRLLALPAIAAALCASASPPPLAKTTLYSQTARNCRLAELPRRDPARLALQQAGATVARTERCNDGKFTIYTVDLRYDPLSPGTAQTYRRLYARLAQATGWNSFAMVDRSDDAIVLVTAKKATRTIAIDYEQFTGD